MLDINKAIDDHASGRHDPEGHMHGLPRWSREIAQQQASDEGMDVLSDMQWRVIYTLRDLHRRNGRAGSARQIICVLEKDFLEEKYAGGLPLTVGLRNIAPQIAVGLMTA